MNRNTKYFIEPGQRFGRLLVIKEFSFTDKRGWKERRVACLCDCGNLMDCKINSLFKFTQSCGCYRRENSAKLLRTHGKYYDPIYNIYRSMRSRCYYKNNKNYMQWGGRGIIICDEWLSHPELFVDWAYKNGYKKGLTIERKDNNKGYSPDNCTFVDRLRQANNTRNNRIIEYNGEKLSMADFCRKWDICYDTFRQRLDLAKKPVELAMLNCGYYRPMNETDRQKSIYQKL